MGNGPPADELTRQGHLCFLTADNTTQYRGHIPWLVSSALQARGRGVAQHFISGRPECYGHLNTHQSGGPEALPKGWGGGGDFLQDLASSFRLSSSGGFLYLLKYDPIFYDHDSEDSVPGPHASPRLCSHREDLTSLSAVLAIRRPAIDHLLMTISKSASSAPPLLPTAPCSSPNVMVNTSLVCYLAVFVSIHSLPRVILSASLLTLAVCGFAAPRLTLIKLHTLSVVWY